MIASPKLLVVELADRIKANTSRWIHEIFPVLDTFSWQEGYGAFSVSQSMKDVVVEYIRNQQEHHRKQTFQEELRVLLDRHGIEYDSRYV